MVPKENVLIMGMGSKGPQAIPLNITGLVAVAQGGKYAEATQAGRVFTVANQAAVAVTAAFAATFTGLAIGNPANSNVKLSLIGFDFGCTVAGISVGTVGIMGGPSGIVPITASLTIQNALLGGPASRCTATAGQTINAAPAPTLLRIMGITGTAATNLWQCLKTSTDLDGAISVPPGYFLAT